MEQQMEVMRAMEQGNLEQIHLHEKHNPTEKIKTVLTRIGVSCSLVTLLSFSLQVQAAPQGGVVTGGQGSIAYGNNTTINQNTSSLAIDWQSFNVNSNESVRFVQPSSSAISLNRILDQNPSQIFGSINANGRVFLSNPNGLIFGDSATVNVGSFVASGLDINTADFMQGNYRFGTLGIDGGPVINRGLIQAASGGSVSLVGSSVQNEGVIVANYGTVNLGAGQTAVLDFDGDGLIRFQVDGAVLNNALGVTSAVDNQGEISANGGEVLLTGAATQDVFSRIVNNDGLIEAGRIDNNGGVVRLVGVGQGEVINSGTIDATGQDAVSTGGTVHLLGEKVGLFDTAMVDASGSAGGGTVLIGGDREGLNPEISNATATFISPDATVMADALKNGNGGKVIVYADGTSKIYGDLSAHGGIEGGNGGFIETSGKGYFELTRTPDVSATNGYAGEWLIDPYDLTIVSATPNTIINDGSNNFVSTSTQSELAVDLITAALTNNAVVTVQTGEPADGSAVPGQLGDINLDAALTTALNGDNKKTTLNLIAKNDININQPISYSNSSPGTSILNLNLIADNNVNVSNSITEVSASTGKIAKINLTLTSDYDNSNAGNVSVTGNISTGGGYFRSGALDGGGALISGGVDFTNTGTITTVNDQLTTAVGNVDIYQNGTVTLGNINVGNSLVSGESVVTVIAGGAVSQASSTGITATTLDVTTKNPTGANITLGDDGSITGTTNDVDVITFKAMDAAGNNAVNGNIVFKDTDGFTVDEITTAGTVSLTSGGAIDQSGASGVITANSLTTSSVNGTVLDANNIVESFSATNTTSGDINLNNNSDSGTLTLETISQTGANVIITEVDAIDINNTMSAGSGDISLTAGSSVSQSAAITGNKLTVLTKNDSTVSTDAAITLDNSNNNVATIDLRSRNSGDTDTGYGDITYRDTDGFAVDVIETNGNVNLYGGGVINQSGVGAITGNLLTVNTLNNSGAAITLDDANNDVSNIDLQSLQLDGTTPAAGNITYTDNNGFAINAITTTGDVTLTAGGAITQPGTAMTGNTLTVKILNDTTPITFDNVNNDFNYIDLRSRTVADAIGSGTITYSDIDGYIINNIETTGNVILTGKDAITQAGAGSVNADVLTVKTYNDSGAVITLDGTTNDVNNINLQALQLDGTTPAAGNITYTDTNGFDINAITTTGDVTLTAGGAITQPGTAMTGNTLTVKILNDTTPITFDNANNDFNYIDLRSRTVADAIGSGTITYSDIDGYIINNIETTGNVILTGKDAITQAGAGSVNADVLTVKTYNDSGAVITLDGTTNDANNINLQSLKLDGTTPAAGNISYTDTNGFAIDAITTTGDVTLTAGDTITQSATAMSGRTLTVDMQNTAAAITFDNLSNDFDYIDLQSTGSGAITYRDIDGFEINNISTTGNTILSGGDNIVQSSGGSIVANLLRVKTFNDTGASITLSNQTNDVSNIDLQSLMAYPSTTVSSGNISYGDSNGFAIDNIITTGDVSLTSHDTITQAASAMSGNTLTVKLLNNTGNITFDNVLNDFNYIDLRSRTSDDSAVGSGVITYRDVDGFMVNTIETSGNVILSGKDVINQSNDGYILGDLLKVKTFNDTGAAITLGQQTNDVNNVDLQSLQNSDPSVISSGNITYADYTGFDIDNIKTVGDVTLIAGDTITQPGTAMTGNTLTVKMLNDTAAITFNNTSNNFNYINLRSRNSADTASGSGEITYRDTDGFTIKYLETTGNVILSGGDTIDQTNVGYIKSALLRVKTFNDTGAAITLEQATNDVTNIDLRSLESDQSTVASGNITYRDANAFAIDNIKTTNNVTLTAGDAITQGATALTGNVLTVKTLNDVGANITLDSSSNDFASIDLKARNSSDTAAAAGDITYTDATGFDILAVETTGDVVLTAHNAITQSAAISGNVLTVTMLNASENISLLDAANDFNSIDLHSRDALGSATGSGNISYADVDDLIVSNLETQGDVSLVANGAISQDATGAILSTGLTVKTLNDTGSSIILDSANNDVDTIDLRSRNSADNAVSAGDITYRDANGFSVDAIETTGTVILISGDAISQTGSIVANSLSTTSVAGVDLTDANEVNTFLATNTTSGDIVFANTATNGVLAIGPITETGGNVSITESGSIEVIDAVDAGAGNLTLTSGGYVEQTASGALSGTELTVLTSNDSGSPITLDAADNRFQTISLSSQKTDATTASGTIAYKELDSVIVKKLESSGDITLTSGGAVDASTALIKGQPSLTIDAGGSATLGYATVATYDVYYRTTQWVWTGTTWVQVTVYKKTGAVVTDITDMSSLSLNDLTIKSGGNVTLSGNVTAAGDIVVNPASSVSLGNYSPYSRTMASDGSYRTIQEDSTQISADNIYITSASTVSMAGDFTANGSEALFSGTSFTTTNLRSLMSGTSLLTVGFDVNSQNSIGLGGSSGSGLTLTDAQLAAIDADIMKIETDGSVIINSVVMKDNIDSNGNIVTPGTDFIIRAGDPTVQNSDASIQFLSNSYFASLDASANNGILISGVIETTSGGLSLDADANLFADDTLGGYDNNIVFDGSDLSRLKSAGSLTLAAATGDGLIINNATTFDTSEHNGDINLGLIHISSSDAKAGSLSLISGLGTITIGDIGVRADGTTIRPLSSLYTETSSAVYLNGDIYVNGVGGVDLGNSDMIVLTNDVSIESYSNDVNLGLYYADGSNTPTPIYSSLSGTTAPYYLQINAGSGNVQLGPIGQSAPAGLGALESLIVLSSDTTSLYGSVTTTGDINLAGVTTLQLLSDVTMNSSGYDISMGKVLSDSYALNVNAGAGNVDVGDVKVTGLSVISTGTTSFNGTSVESTGNINLTRAANIEMATDLTFSTEGALLLQGLLSGSNSLLTANATGGITLVGNKTTISGVSVDFTNAAVTGPGALEIIANNTADTVILSSVTNAESLTVSNPGSTILLSDISTQSSAGIDLSNTNTTLAKSNITLNTEVGNGLVNLDGSVFDGSYGLTISSADGDVTLGNLAIGYLVVTSNGTTTLDNSMVKASSSTGIDFSGALETVLIGDVELSTWDMSGAINLTQSLDGAGGLTVWAGTAGVSFGEVGSTVPLDYLIVHSQGASNYAGDVYTNGNIDLTDSPINYLGNNILFDSVQGNIDLTGTLVDGTNDLGSYSLVINAQAGDVLLGTIGAGTDAQLDSLTVKTPATTYLSGNVSTSGSGAIDLSQAANVVLLSDVSLVNTYIDPAGVTVGEILLTSDINGAFGLNVVAQTANVSFGLVGQTTPLTSLDVTTGGSVDLSNDISTTGTANIHGSSITMDTDALLQTQNSNVTFTATNGNVLLGEINAGTAAVAIKAGNGDILNNRGISNTAPILINITSDTLTLDATNKIGVSTVDPITIDVPGSVQLAFGAETAYIRNIRGAPITVIRGDTVIDVFQSSRVEAYQSTALGQSVKDDDEEDDDDEKEEKETDIITWLDNTRSPDVPRMIHTKKGWLFTRANEIVLPEVEVKPKNQKKESGSWTRDMFKF